jgi:hypothetical protein
MGGRIISPDEVQNNQNCVWTNFYRKETIQDVTENGFSVS